MTTIIRRPDGKVSFVPGPGRMVLGALANGRSKRTRLVAGTAVVATLFGSLSAARGGLTAVAAPPSGGAGTLPDDHALGPEGTTPLPELEIWGRGSGTLASSVGPELEEALYSGLPDGAETYADESRTGERLISAATPLAARTFADVVLALASYVPGRGEFLVDEKEMTAWCKHALDLLRGS